MEIVFKDRQSAYPNRYKVTPQTGSSYYVYLERADEPIEVGTPLNAETFNGWVAEVADEIAALHARIDEASGSLGGSYEGDVSIGGIISFTIDGKTYKAISDMTFGEWVAYPEYNTDGFELRPDYEDETLAGIHKDYYTLLYNAEWVQARDKIVEGRAYITQYERARMTTEEEQ